MSTKLPEYAFYYPNPVWADGDWIKNLLLFFDGVALLVPSYIRDKPFRVDPAIAIGLQEHGLLQILEPETLLDRAAAESLATSLVDIISSGALDSLGDEAVAFDHISYSRLGYMADRELAQMVLEELRSRRLASESVDGVSIPMHPLVRSLVLVLLAQILRPAGARSGLALHPATDQPRIHNALSELLGISSMPSAGHVVSLDIKTVGVDLGPIPLDEVLDFRAQHGKQYRKYAQDLKEFIHRCGLLSPEQVEGELVARRQQIQDTAESLRQVAQKSWKKPASFGLGIAGAAWTVGSGDIVGGMLAMGAGLLAGVGNDVGNADAYSYLFDARQRFG